MVLPKNAADKLVGEKAKQEHTESESESFYFVSIRRTTYSYNSNLLAEQQPVGR